MPPFRRPKTLEIVGYRQTLVPCALHTFGGESEVAVVFPGGAQQGNRVGGTPARPDLHYTRALLQTEGFAVFEVWWDAGTIPAEDLEGWLDANVAAALAAASQAHAVGLLAGRSLGTRALARAVSSAGWEARAVPTVWLAPLLTDPPILNALENLRSPAFVVGGTEDELFDVAEAEALRERGVDVVVLDGANHGLEVDDPVASARLLADVVDAMHRFIRRARRLDAG